MQLVDDKNLSSVSKQLAMSVASASRCLKQLEQALGAQLLERAHTVSRLTEAGQAFLSHAKSICETMNGVAGLVLKPSVISDPILAVRATMHLTLAQIQSFMALAKLNSYRDAAHEMQQLPSALSRTVSDLEHLLASQLFERKRSGAILTPTGKALVPLMAQLQRQHAQAVSCMLLWRNHTHRKLLIVGSNSIMTHVMPSLVCELKQEFPDHLIDIHHKLSDQVEQAVYGGDAVVGVCAVVREKAYFSYSYLLEVQLGLVWHPNFPMPPSMHSLDQLDEASMIRFHDKAIISQALLDSHTVFPAYFNASVMVDSVEAGIGLVQSGGFAMIIMGVSAERVIHQGLKFLPLPNLLPRVKVATITARSSPFDERRERIREVLQRSVVSKPWHESIKMLCSLQ